MFTGDIKMGATQSAPTLEFEVLAENLGFPEGPLVLPDGSVLVVEIATGQVSRCSRTGGSEVVAVTGGGPNGAALGPDGHAYVCNSGGGKWHRDATGRHVAHALADGYVSGWIDRINLETGAVERLYDRSDKGYLLSPNDIVFDAQGGFWFTDLGHIGEDEIKFGGICYAKTDGSSIRRVVFPILTPNGIGLSPDGKTLYVAETLTSRIFAFDVVGPGQLSEKPKAGRMIYADDVRGAFDSLAIEANGNICVATMGSERVAGITVITPQGERVERVLTGDRQTTNICFGGADMKTAYITTSTASRLVAVPWKRPGLKLNF
jgi:gluconolactonase